MRLELTVQGLLIYAALSAYLGAFIALLARSAATGRRLYVAGFGLALAAFIYRWQDVQHVPLQSMFEVFLCLGMLAYPLSVLYRRAFGIGGDAADVLVGFVLLFAAGFVFPPEQQRLPPPLQSWLFVPHVAAYMLAYVIMFKASTQAAAVLLAETDGQQERIAQCERATYCAVRLGFPLMTLGLILGALWANLAWGRYWGWDPKEALSLATWLVYLVYLHFRQAYGVRFPRANAALALCGAIFVVVTLVWVNLPGSMFPGLHAYA